SPRRGARGATSVRRIHALVDRRGTPVASDAIVPAVVSMDSLRAHPALGGEPTITGARAMRRAILLALLFATTASGGPAAPPGGPAGRRCVARRSPHVAARVAESPPGAVPQHHPRAMGLGGEEHRPAAAGTESQSAARRASAIGRDGGRRPHEPRAGLVARAA